MISHAAPRLNFTNIATGFTKFLVVFAVVELAFCLFTIRFPFTRGPLEYPLAMTLVFAEVLAFVPRDRRWRVSSLSFAMLCGVILPVLVAFLNGTFA